MNDTQTMIMELDVFLDDRTDTPSTATIEEAIKALEKQVPKRVEFTDTDYMYYECPNCGDAIMTTEDDFSSHKYCLSCGQALKWED